jgi:hypothetical protein
VATNGRIGAKPRETRHEMGTPEAAQQEADRQIAAKLRKGYLEGSASGLTPRDAPDWAAMRMTEDTFWRLIALFNWKKLGDDDAVLRPAVAALAQMRVEDICAFEDVLAAKLHALDTERHAREIGDEAYRPGQHFSVDWFLYVRCAVIANGAAFYETALADPAAMPKDIEFEALLSLASAAYEKKTGAEFAHATAVSYETFSNVSGWPRTT